MSSRHCVGTRVTKYYMSLILDTFFIFQIKILKQNTKKTATATKKNTDTRKTTEPHRRVHLLQIRSKCHLRTSAFVFPTKIGPLDPGDQTPFQTNHPEFGAGEAPPNFPVKETGFAFCTFRNPKPNLPEAPNFGLVVSVQDTRYCHHQSAPNHLEVTRHLRQNPGSRSWDRFQTATTGT